MCKTKETNMLQIQKGQDIKQEVLQRYKTILPDELITQTSHVDFSYAP